MKEPVEPIPLSDEARRLRIWRLLLGMLFWGMLSYITISQRTVELPVGAATTSLSQAISIILLALLGTAFLAITARQFSPDTYHHPIRLALLGLIICLSVLAYNIFLVPLPNLTMLFLPAAALVIAVLLSPHLAFAAIVVQGLLVGVAREGAFMAIFPGMAACMAALVCAKHIWPPSQLIHASGQLGLANALIAAAVSLLNAHPFPQVCREAALAFAYGACAPLLALGAIFLLQKPFDITSHVRLLELSNPREPLLNRLQAEAPGSYYSSVIVANLAEAAAQAAGADPLVCRVGALYHDIGKLTHPELFVENQYQTGIKDAHSDLSPSLSALVILAHVRDGVELARRYGLPKSIRDIIEEHHGTTLVRYFYHQARACQNGPPPPEGQYRYEGRPPATKESAIVMLSDALQAAAKALPDPSLERLEALVHEIVYERLEDSQLQDCELTFRDLTRISQSFLQSLRGLHLHTRIEYPAMTKVLDKSGNIDTKSPENETAPKRDAARRPERHAG
jgi:putative nucleotidyltransferase with HDIG domain